MSFHAAACHAIALVKSEPATCSVAPVFVASAASSAAVSNSVVIPRIITKVTYTNKKEDPPAFVIAANEYCTVILSAWPPPSAYILLCPTGLAEATVL